MGLGAIIFGITFWLILDSHKKRKLEKKWEQERLERLAQKDPALRLMMAKKLHRP